MRVSLVTLGLIVVLTTGVANAEDEQLYSCKEGTTAVEVTLKPETSVTDLLTWVMGFTCRNFVLDPRVIITGKKVTIVAPGRLSPSEAYRVFLVALSTVGLTVVQKGPIMQVVEEQAVRRDSVRLHRDKPPDIERFVRFVYRPVYATPETMLQAFGVLKSGAGDVQQIGSIVTSSHTNVVSAPSIIALDNQPAIYKVGTNIPYKKGLSVGGFQSTDALPGAVSTNIDRMDLLLELEITPHISIDNSVLLEIKHESKDLGERDQELGPTWGRRVIDTRVLVRDQQTVVVGGLIQERDMRTEHKVPLLGDIPLLGYLFKYSSRAKRKTNLLVMLTPYIIKDQMDLQQLHERKMREHEDFVRSFKRLATAKYQPVIDYRRKRGVVEEINRAVLGVEEDLAARAALRQAPQVPSGPLEPSSGEPATSIR